MHWNRTYKIIFRALATCFCVYRYWNHSMPHWVLPFNLQIFERQLTFEPRQNLHSNTRPLNGNISRRTKQISSLKFSPKLSFNFVELILTRQERLKSLAGNNFEDSRIARQFLINCYTKTEHKLWSSLQRERYWLRCSIHWSHLPRQEIAEMDAKTVENDMKQSRKAGVKENENTTDNIGVVLKQEGRWNQLERSYLRSQTFQRNSG